MFLFFSSLSPRFQDCVSLKWCNRLQSAGGSGGSVCQRLQPPRLQSGLEQGLHFRGKRCSFISEQWQRVDFNKGVWHPRSSGRATLNLLDLCPCPSSVPVFYPCPSFRWASVRRNKDHYWRQSSQCRQRCVREDRASPLPLREVSLSRVLKSICNLVFCFKCFNQKFFFLALYREGIYNNKYCYLVTELQFFFKRGLFLRWNDSLNRRCAVGGAADHAD